MSASSIDPATHDAIKSDQPIKDDDQQDGDECEECGRSSDAKIEIRAHMTYERDRQGDAPGIVQKKASRNVVKRPTLASSRCVA